MLIFESGSGKYLRILPEAVQFVSSARDATMVLADQLEAIIQQHKLEYVRHTLELKQPDPDRTLREHVKCMIRKTSG
jgi:hypothetical protein